VQTVSVPPGGAWIVEFTVDEPGDYVLVDHALSRLERGLVAMLHVEGTESIDVFHDGPAE
jgi:nitrite reductase (NO-forming)